MTLCPRLVGHEHVRFRLLPAGVAALALIGVLGAGQAVARGDTPAWANRRLTPDQRAALIVDAMTLDEQISILRPMLPQIPARVSGATPASQTTGAIGSAGYAPAIARLGWPALQESDAGLGVANTSRYRPGDEATALPSGLALAASFDPALAFASGQVVGAEAHAKGFNVQLAGGADLARDPRNGRNFEYAGEDPLLAGTIAGASIAGIQSRHVASTTKHYAMNDEETGRTVLDARIDETAARDSDLLAFEIAVTRGHPGAVMCAYNKMNGVYACENDFLLRTVLKGDWRFPGWVMSDWGGVHSLLPALHAGLDQESPQVGNTDHFAGLAASVRKGDVPRAQVRFMVLRIARSLFATGAMDDPALPGGVIDRDADAAVARQSAEAGMVLLKNSGMLPLAGTIGHVAIIGGHADMGVASGGGSSNVAAYGGMFRDTEGSTGLLPMEVPAYVLSSPLKALQAARPDLRIVYDDGSNPARAAAVARAADAALVFATKIQTEGTDSPDLSLPDRQDALIAAVAAANPNTGVVLETGNPVTMPWLASVNAVLEAWYPGQRGGEAIAAILTGAVAPSGRLPVTFPASTAQLPRPRLDGFDPARRASITSPPPPPFTVTYSEGSDVGYRWFERTGARPLFPFGYGLSYTHFSYGDLQAVGGRGLAVRFRLANSGSRAGVETAQLYAAPPERTHRLVGWRRVALKAGESAVVTVTADPRLLASWDAASAGWRQAAGSYDIQLGSAAGAAELHAVVMLAGAQHTAHWRD